MGECGFYSIFRKTRTPGIYYWIRTSSSEFDCGTDPQEYIVLTNNMVKKILSASKKKTDAEERMCYRYQWEDGDYPQYSGDSCETEITDIIKENN